MPNSVTLYDRIKELSYTMGTGNLTLAGAVNGFSDFDSVYNNGDIVFYAITDGTRYEIGSGVFATGVSDSLTRFPLRSSSSNALVDFPEGTKEVYVTYPATHAVYHGSGVNGAPGNQNSGVAFWAGNNVIEYDSNLIWNDTYARLGIRTSNPQYTLDIGGDGYQSTLRTSGIIIGSSGVYFPLANNGDATYSGGRQLAHFEITRLDQYAYDNSKLGHLTGTDSVFQLSGVVNEFLLFKQQNAGTVLAGPPSGCTPPCSPGYPSFRQIVADDVPFVSQASGALNNKINTVSGILYNDITVVSGMFTSGSGSLDSYIDAVSGLLVYAGSGLITYTNRTINLANPTSFYTALASGDAKINDKLLVWQEDSSSWKTMTLYDSLFVPSGNSYIQRKTITNSSDAGQFGQICYDDDYIYVYGNVPGSGGRWKRVGVGIW